MSVFYLSVDFLKRALCSTRSPGEVPERVQIVFCIKHPNQMFFPAEEY